ncbi:hypothetical protein [Streptomyces albireticuli]|uniref:Uncharacterized protein n=1 Tax=Streptomyces albireticuli TaxID=1940 RepID=A0A2A2D5T0_9ACTN|nr:hypothetical protein [Streptomyces albireticuli]MCD9145960.1 hypothetical protein [Streptomyces albireticuli]MCD9194508.1 hypothetical protein [Streptomyces albireticuli]PAU46672.1 hypothetical protein CK936_22960 [Streptomyces albireticuli]
MSPNDHLTDSQKHMRDEIEADLDRAEEQLRKAHEDARSRLAGFGGEDDESGAFCFTCRFTSHPCPGYEKPSSGGLGPCKRSTCRHPFLRHDVL